MNRKLEMASHKLSSLIRASYTPWFAVGIREGPLVEREELVIYHEGKKPVPFNEFEGYPIIFHKTEQPTIG